MRRLSAITLALSLALSLALPLAGTALWAQSLSVSEEAAQTQRQPTDEEIALWKAECPLPGATNAEAAGTLAGLPAVTGDVAPISMLLTVVIQVTDDSENGQAIKAYPPLPSGGIAGKDLCGPILVHMARAKKVPGSVTGFMSLRLRSGLDLNRDYPNTSKTIAERGQVRSFPPGRYLIVEGADQKIADALAKDPSGLWSGAEITHILMMGGTLYARLAE